MKFVHAADLHLDSPLVGLERYPGAPAERVRAATRGALKALVSLCIEEEAALLLISGDLYDGDWRDYSTGLFFSREMARLKHAGIPVVWIRGNHDAQSVITKHLELPSNTRELPVERPGTIIFDDIGIAVHGQGFATRAVLEDLSGAYPARCSGLLNVGLLHTSVNGRAGHDPYAPCRLEALVNKGYDYWALGHVHQTEVLSRDPWVVFPGNLQGRHIKETGPKGAMLVTVDADGVTAAEHRALDVVRFVERRVEISEAGDAHDVLELCRRALEAGLGDTEGRLFAVRVVLEGRSRAHAGLARAPEAFAANLRSVASDLADDAIWIAGVEQRSQDLLDWRALAKQSDAIGELIAAVVRSAGDGTLRAELLAELAPLRGRLPADFPELDAALGLSDEAAFELALDELANVILPELFAESDA